MINSKIIQNLDSIIYELKKKTGMNIQNLKPGFVERRVDHRMRALGIIDFDEYVRILATSLDEAKNLCDAFSINVTKFFRDPIVWSRIEQDIVPEIAAKRHFSPIRVWSCGSASGEEPHSISILFNDSLKGTNNTYRIHASDISIDAITRAKKGVYRPENLVNVSSERLATHFKKISDEQFQVDLQISNKIEYQKSDMMKNSENLFDIIFCRNVLIYYNKEAHEKIFKKFSESLKENGILVLGQDESMIGTKSSDLFELRYPKERIYQKKSV